MSSLTEIKTPQDFSSHTDSLPPTTLLVISFQTPWAAPCAQQTLILRTLASSYPLQTPPVISFLSIDAEALPDISESFDVTAVPYLVLQRDGKVLETVSGSDAAKVREAVEKHAGKGGNTGKLGLPPALETTPRKEEEATDGRNGEAQTNGASASNLSKYAPGANDPATAPEMSSSAGQTEELNKRLAELVKAAPVMLFMKGTPSTPQCGFSRTLVGLLREKGVRYGFFNILADEDVRQGLKVWADWPTFPQLWMGGELVGGLDIVKEELESDPDFFSEYSVGQGKGGMAAPEAQVQPTAA
ncbi:MAG: monothiol glutaredoxin grx4 [Heterodermia speciosa]|uniref:Monothiol glutaredoxin grx4 n=1 Tax=Heterodermia speciosa TaxID=116794 RepID=A0A8H3EPS5_9LECA|nr:MAG: monothiol glutaredoxin grx4 [Heterodermia speciosa]